MPTSRYGPSSKTLNISAGRAKTRHTRFSVILTHPYGGSANGSGYAQPSCMMAPSFWKPYIQYPVTLSVLPNHRMIWKWLRLFQRPLKKQWIRGHIRLLLLQALLPFSFGMYTALRQILLMFRRTMTTTWQKALLISFAMPLDYPTWEQQHTYSTAPYKQMEYQKQHMFLLSLGRQPCPTTSPLRARRCISRRKCSKENDTFLADSLIRGAKRKCTIFKLFRAFNFWTFAGKKQPDCGNFEVPICPQIPCGQIATIWVEDF